MQYEEGALISRRKGQFKMKLITHHHVVLWKEMGVSQSP